MCKVPLAFRSFAFINQGAKLSFRRRFSVWMLEVAYPEKLQNFSSSGVILSPPTCPTKKKDKIINGIRV